MTTKKLQLTVTEMTQEDLEAATAMRLQSWLDTYVNDEIGVTREWIEQRNKTQMSADSMERRRSRLKESVLKGWVAKGAEGKIIGVTTPYIDEGGNQRIGALYVDKAYHGKGVGSALLQKAIDGHDPTKPIQLEVVSYNKRAKMFYKKWGFEEIPNSDMLFADKIPEVKMIRKAQNEI